MTWVDVVRYTFIVRTPPPLLLAGLPAHTRLTHFRHASLENIAPQIDPWAPVSLVVNSCFNEAELGVVPSLRQAMRRRDFITGFAGLAAAWPFASHAQQSVPIIGFLNSAVPEPFAPYVRAFLQGLEQFGFIDGKTVVIDYRWSRGQDGQLAQAARDLANRPVEVIVATGGEHAAIAAKAVTSNVPIIFSVRNSVALSRNFFRAAWLGALLRFHAVKTLSLTPAIFRVSAGEEVDGAFLRRRLTRRDLLASGKNRILISTVTIRIAMPKLPTLW